MASNTARNESNDRQNMSTKPVTSSSDEGGKRDGGSREGVSRTMAKLERRIADGEYYEAHQLYRIIYFRYISQNKFAEALDLLTNGSMALLKANQMSSGADLALLMVSLLEKNKAEVSEENIMKVATLHKLIDREHIERPSFVVAALRWAKQAAPPSSSSASNSSTNSSASSVLAAGSSGNPILHGRFAITYWHERDYTQARYHFVRSKDGEGCAAMLVENHVTQGYPGEVDLFIAQTVFQYLCLRNKITAEVCFNCYTKQHPQVERGPPFILPLLNFIWMLLLIVEGGNLSVFTILCEQYQLSLTRDPCYNDYIARIGQVFFHLPPPRPSHGQGIFGNILSSFLTMEEETEDDRLVAEQLPEELD